MALNIERHGRKPTRFPVCIYALHASDSPEFRYIGQTGSPGQRLWAHLNGKSASQITEWVREVESRGATVEMVVLAIVPWKHAKAVEADYIEKHRFGLLNTLAPGHAPSSGRRVLGPAPKTLGWLRLVEWLGVKGNNVSRLARAVGVAPPSAHAWRWLIGQPASDTLPRICAVIGGTPEEWSQPATEAA